MKVLLAAAALAVCFGASASAVAQDCPAAPPTANTTTSGTVESSANLLLRWIGSLLIKGGWESDRTAIYDQFKDPDKNFVDHYVLYMFCRQISSDPHLTTKAKIELIRNFRMDLATVQVADAVEKKEGYSPPPLEQALSPREQAVGADRDFESDLAGLVGNARILWIDDAPGNNAREIAALETLGHQVDMAESNKEAEEKFARGRYDLIVSDISRQQEGAEAGLELPERLARLGDLPPIIYYIRRVQGPLTPDGHPVTNKPSELFRLVGEALPANSGG